MLFKLAILNSRRSLGRYLIYIMTVTISIALIYATTGLVLHPQIQNLSKTSKWYFLLLMAASGLVVIIMAWMVKYMTNYILSLRSREFGTYMLLGIESRDISKLYAAEQVILGTLSSLLGIALGSIILEILKAVVFHFMQAGYILSIDFSWKSLGITILFVIFIYLAALFNNARKFRRLEIIDLFEIERRNEETVIKGNGFKIITFLISLLSIGINLWIFTRVFQRKDSFGTAGICTIILLVSIYGVTASLPEMVSRVLLHGNNCYRKRVLAVRFFRSKINEMAKKLGTLTVILIVALSCVTAAILFSNFYQDQLKELNNYDLMLRWDEEPSYVEGVQEITERYGVIAKADLAIYEDPAAILRKEFMDTGLVSDSMTDSILSLTDYNELRTLAGYPIVAMESDEFIVQSSSTAYEHLKDCLRKETYPVLGTDLRLNRLIGEPMSTEMISYTGYYLIVNDEILKGYRPYTYRYLWKLSNQNYQALHDELLSYAKSQGKGIRNVLYGFNKDTVIELSWNYDIMGYKLEEARTGIIVIILSMFYMAMVFCAVLATVLAISLVGDAAKYHHRYLLLYKIGMDKADIARLIRNQILWIFGFPLILGIPITVVILYGISNIFTGYAVEGFFLRSIGFAALLFFGLYGSYMLVTYLSYRKAVEV